MCGNDSGRNLMRIETKESENESNRDREREGGEQKLWGKGLACGKLTENVQHEGRLEPMLMVYARIMDIFSFRCRRIRASCTQYARVRARENV